MEITLCDRFQAPQGSIQGPSTIQHLHDPSRSDNKQQQQNMI